MRGQSENLDEDEVLLEVYRMRNSLNSVVTKKVLYDEEVRKLSPPPLPTTKPPTPPTSPYFKRTSSYRHSRQDSNRSYSRNIEKEDILKALIIEGSKNSNAEISPQNTISTEEKRVHFVNDQLPSNVSRESDEVATINEMPWQKKHEYRVVTPYFKPKNKIKTLNDRENVKNENISLGFRPIEKNQSYEDIDSAIYKPVALFPSKSYQELQKISLEDDFGRTKSNEDLLLDNIDGAHKFTESKTHKLMRFRSISNNTLNKIYSTSDHSVYENYKFQSQSSIDENKIRKTKKPMPQPRSSFQFDVADNKRSSKTLVYVLDKQKDEFVLQEEYENVLINNDIDQYRDSALFNALLNSREDCKSSFIAT